jgi:predicted ATPase
VSCWSGGGALNLAWSCSVNPWRRCGKFDEALQTIDVSIALAERNGDLFMMPELLRIKADILARAPRSHLIQAEKYFLKSLQLAASQAALAWELRTTISLARFWLRQGRIQGARDKLALVIDRFSEGFERADLKAARLLLFEMVQAADHTPYKTLSGVSRI